MPEVGIPSSGIPDLAASELDCGEPLEIRPPRDYPIREARLAQDAHTRGEQAVYAALWKVSEEGKRLVSIGLTTLARRAGMSRSTCQANLATLEAKLSIEIHEPRAKGGSRSYRVLSYEEILRRRRAAGLTHFQRVTSSVRLLSAVGRDLDAGIPNVGMPKLNFTIPNLGIPENNSGIPDSGMPGASSGIPTLGTENISNRSNKTTTPQHKSSC
jgi:hypothetical protein